jgi:PAS domain S-box-containing protein
MIKAKPVRILLAEDDYFVSGKIQESLEDAGYEVVGVAVNGEEAVALTLELKPDAVLMDIRMPRKDGLEATREIQELCPTPVVALSSYDDAELVNRAGAAGVAAYLVKPANTMEIDRAISVARARFADLMESRRLYKALRDSEMRFSRIVEKSRAGYFRLDSQGRVFEYVNEAFALMHGFDRAAEMTGLPYLDTVSPETRERASKMIQEILDGKTSSTEELSHRRKDGSAGHHSLTASPVLQYGQVVGVEGFLIDTTERRQAALEKERYEEQARRIQRHESLAMMAGGVAHDFNNLLMGVMGNAELLLMDLPADDPNREMVQEIEKTARRAADLSGLMLAFSGHGKFIVEEMNLAEQIEEAAVLSDAGVPEGVRVEYTLDKSVAPIHADSAQLLQLFKHILTNAIEALEGRSGVIRVQVGSMAATREFLSECHIDDGIPAGQYVFLKIEDTGRGMDAEAVRRVCDPFFTTKFMGRGLGMAAVLGIVRGHAGALRVTSKPSVGTTVLALFPAAGKGPEEKAEAEAKANQWRGSGLVLLVDDEEPVRNVGKRMLERIGFSVVTAGDGDEGVALYERLQDRVRCVLLDLTMPRMNGETAFREIRRIRKNAPIVVSSGYTREEVAEKFKDKGLTGFIQKPYQSGKLLETLRSILG